MRGLNAWVAICAGGALLAPPASAAPVATGSQVRAFLNGGTGKLVYTKLDCNDNSCNKRGRSLWYLDFNDATLVERQIVSYSSAGVEPRNSAVSPDGQWVVYNTLNADNTGAGNALYACRVQQNAATPVSLGSGALPYWWVKPGTSELYLIYNDKDLEPSGGWQMSFPSSSTRTYCMQINPANMNPIGSGSQLIQYHANGGRSMNGAWLFAAGGCPGTFHIDSTATSAASVLEDVSLSVNAGNMYDTLDGCNPSISPHWRESDIRVMYVCRDGSNNHRGYWLCDVRGNNRQRIMWSNTENPYPDEPQWSNHRDYAAAKASVTLITAPYDIYIYRVWDGLHLKVLEGNYSFPYLWVDSTNIGVRLPAGSQRLPQGWQVRVADGALALSNAQGSVVVADVRGRAVASRSAVPAGGRLPVRLAAGTYTVSLRAPDGHVSARRVVVR